MRANFPRSLKTLAIGLGFLIAVTGHALPVAAQATSDVVDENGDRITLSDQGGTQDDTFVLADAAPIGAAPMEAAPMEAAPMQAATAQAMPAQMEPGQAAMSAEAEPATNAIVNMNGDEITIADQGGTQDDTFVLADAAPIP